VKWSPVRVLQLRPSRGVAVVEAGRGRPGRGGARPAGRGGVRCERALAAARLGKEWREKAPVGLTCY
jgi:hypothetical protein